jgi:hypothetical protein
MPPTTTPTTSRPTNAAEPGSTPAHGRTTVAEWVATWFAALDLDPRTLDNLYVPESTSVQVTAIGARLVAVRHDRGSC